MQKTLRAFTLVEILVVLAIIATLLTFVTPRYFETLSRSKETSLKHDLATMRDAIDKFYGDKGFYPDNLEDLIDKKYLRAIPLDPITESNSTWILIPPEDNNIQGSLYNIHSGSPEAAMDGTMYADW